MAGATQARERSLLVTEVYSAIQGEGALVGERQVFLRTTGCNLRCIYCDQPEALEKQAGPCRTEVTPGRRDWKVRQSPLATQEVVEAVDRLWKSLPHHSVSITGGEPLLQAGRLSHVLPLMKERGHSVMLETNGSLPHGLELVLPWIDHVSMDIKLDSVDRQGVDLATQEAFARLAFAKALFVKIVLGPSTDASELETAVAMVGRISADVEIFLQPVTPFAEVTRAPTPEQVLELQSRALRVHPRVRVVPQTHKLIDQL